MRGLFVCILAAAGGLGGVHAETGSYADYALLLDQVGGYFRDGTVIDGPVRVNANPRIYSYTPGRDNDPWFYSFTTSADSFLTMLADTTVWILAADPHPEGTNLWIEPYELMIQGPPWFILGADPIPFGQDSVDWETLYNTAIDSGIFYDSLLSGTRILLEADSIHLKQTVDSPVESYCLSDLEEPVVWLDNGPTDEICIRSIPPDSGSGLSVPLTIGCNGHVYVIGDILYQPMTGGMLGMVIKNGDMLIAETPSSDPWTGIWKIETEKEMVCSGSFLLLEGMFLAEHPWEPNPAVDFTILGGLQAVGEYITALITPAGDTMGYLIENEFDNRFFTSSPPFYPTYDTGTGIAGGSAQPIAGSIIEVLGNPFGETLVLELTDAGAGPCTVLLLDISGRLVLRSSITDTGVLQTGDLPSGAYVLVVETADGIMESRTVVRLR